MYAVFAKTLLTDKGKSLVREHEKDYDAQQIHTKLLDYVQKIYKGLSGIITTSLWRALVLVLGRDQVIHSFYTGKTKFANEQCSKRGIVGVIKIVGLV